MSFPSLQTKQKPILGKRKVQVIETSRILQLVSSTRVCEGGRVYSKSVSFVRAFA